MGTHHSLPIGMDLSNNEPIRGSREVELAMLRWCQDELAQNEETRGEKGDEVEKLEVTGAASQHWGAKGLGIDMSWGRSLYRC